MSAGIAWNMETYTPTADLPRVNQKPRVWTVFATWLLAAIVGQVAAVAAMIMTGVCIGIVMGAQGYDAATIQTRAGEMIQQPLPLMILTMLPFQIGMALVVLLAARRSREPLPQRLGLAPTEGPAVSPLKLASLGSLTLATALTVAIALGMLFGNASANSTSATISNGSWWAVALVGLILAIVPAVIEEVVFRGYIQRRLLERWSPATAIAVSTLLFAVLHADSLQHILAVIPLGVITGLLAYRTKSVKAGMLVHAVHNTGAVAFGVFVRVITPVLGDEAAGFALIVLILGLGAIGLPAAIALLRGSPSATNEQPSVQPTSGQSALESLASQPA